MTPGIARRLLAEGREALTEASTRTGEYAGAVSLLEGARLHGSAEGDRVAEAEALDSLAMVAHYENITVLIGGGTVDERAAAEEEALFRRALAMQLEIGDREGEARSLFGLGPVWQVLRGDWTTALPYFLRALDIVDSLPGAQDVYLQSEVHRHVGFSHLVADVQPDDAVRHLARSLELREQLQDPRRVPSGLVALGRAELAAGNPGRAVELLRRAVAEARAVGLLPHWIADAEQALEEAEAAARPPVP